MKLGTKVRYGTRVMVELAQCDEQAPLSLGEIVARQELSGKYAESLMAALRAAGLVQSSRGSQGGYRLSRAPEQISVLDIFQAFESSESFVPCAEDATACPLWQTCATRDVWLAMHQASMGVLQTTTLADLAERGRDLQADAIPNYSI
jgi:Rrf2 family protein